MASITTRAGKGSPLTNAEVDANFTNLNAELLTKQDALGFTPANKAGDTFTGNVLVNSGADSRVLLQSGGTTQGQVQATGSAVRLASNNALPLYLSQNGVDLLDVTTTAIVGNRHFRVPNSASHNYGFVGEQSAGTGKWNLFMSGTASNYLAGATIFNNAIGLGSVSSPSYGTVGQVLTSAGAGAAPTWTTLTGALSFTGDVTGTGSTGSSTSLTLANSGVTAGVYGANAVIPSITVDAKGRVTNAAGVTPSGTWGISITGSAGSISGYNNPTTAATANTIAYRDANGDIAAREIVLSSSVSSATPTTLVSMYPSSNQLVRTTPAAVSAAIQGAASGTWGISITGSAAQLGGRTSAQFSGIDSAVKTFFISNLQASGTQARTFEIARLAVDYNDWNGGSGPFEIELYEKYYGPGLKKKYVVFWGYSNNYGIQLVEYAGSGDNNFRARIGAPVQVSGDHYYLPVYVDVRYYYACDVRITTNRITTSSNPPPIGQTYINTAPGAVNISDFTADSVPSLSASGAAALGSNTILHAGNYNSYAPTLTGGGASGTWGISITGTANALSGFTNSTAGSPVAGPDALTNNGHAYVQSISLLGQTDGALYAQAYNSTWVHQIYGDYRTGQIAIRGKNSGTWQAWRTVLDSGNYNNYALPLSGGTLSGNLTVGSSDYNRPNALTIANDVNWSFGASSNNSTTYFMQVKYHSGSGGTNNRGFRVLDARTGSANFLANDVGAQVNGSIVLHAGNVASYAMPIMANGAITEFGQTISANYTVSSGKNALSAGPITINNGITVTVPDGCVWVIV